MYPLTAATVIQTKELWEELQALFSVLSVRVLFETTSIYDWAAFQERISRTAPDIVILDVAAAGDSLQQTIQKIRTTPPNPQVFAVHTVADPDLILTVLRAGAAEYLYPPFDQSFRNALERVNQNRERARETVHSGGNVIGFVSAKGGCGSTTIACHVASYLPEVARGRVLLADLDLSSGIIGFLMRAKSSYSVSDAASNLQRLDMSYWRGIISNGYPGLEVLSAPSHPAGKDLKPEHLRHILRFTRTQYDWVVADLGRNLNATSLGTFDGFDRVYLVTTADVAALHQAKQMIRVLLDAGYSRDKLALVLNRMPKRLDVTLEELERMLGLPLLVTIPNDYHALEEVYTEGKLLPPESGLGRNYLRLTRKIAGVEESPKKSRFGFF
jgi:pilus assembly protein CpaE